jgi:uncharacterized membrane protein
MLAIEISCLAILAVYLATHAREPGLLRDAALLAAAAWIAEDTCIRAYGFYQYSPAWHAQLDRAPLMIPLIWPAVVLSARTLARALLRGGGGPLTLGALTGALVTFDAALIEPIAVRAGLWSWNEPGVFHVPVIGILGWGLFAAVAVPCLETLRGPVRLATVVLAPLGTHALLLAAWWGLFRWVLRAEIPPAAAAGAIAGLAVGYIWAVRARGARVGWRELVPRAAATGFFAVLLAGAADGALAAYAAAFTPPHLLLCAGAWRRREARAPVVA